MLPSQRFPLIAVRKTKVGKRHIPRARAARDKVYVITKCSNVRNELMNRDCGAAMSVDISETICILSVESFCTYFSSMTVAPSSESKVEADLIH